jgi:hypothetical protein
MSRVMAIMTRMHASHLFGAANKFYVTSIRKFCQRGGRRRWVGVDVTFKEA